jgi:F420-non-reducing hydrogenase iron-sulfur subunit
VVETMVEALGLEPERFRLVWCSSAEADRFVAAVREMTAAVRQLGPSPYREGCAPIEVQEVAACR